MTADRRDQLASALMLALLRLHTEKGPFSGEAAVELADALLPVVDRMIRQAQAEALESAARAVQTVYDMQCPVRPAGDYVDRGAYMAHSWWAKVLGGSLERLCDRAAALRATTDHGAVTGTGARPEMPLGRDEDPSEVSPQPPDAAQGR